VPSATGFAFFSAASEALLSSSVLWRLSLSVPAFVMTGYPGDVVRWRLSLSVPAFVMTGYPGDVVRWRGGAGKALQFLQLHFLPMLFRKRNLHRVQLGSAHAGCVEGASHSVELRHMPWHVHLAPMNVSCLYALAAAREHVAHGGDAPRAQPHSG
jgi:hypothetical protein